MGSVKSIAKRGNELNTKFDHAVMQKSYDLFMGRELPNEKSLEELVLGAIIVDSDAIGKVKSFLKPEHFYTPALQEIYEGTLEMEEKNIPIDIATVCTYLKDKKVAYLKLIEGRHTKYTGSVLDKVGGPGEIAMLTNRIGSDANIEYHARIIQDRFLQRETISLAIKSIQDVYQLGTLEIYDYRNELANTLRVNAINDFFKIETLNQSIINAESEPDIYQMIGSLWMYKQISVLFADSGMGKSVLAFQMGQAISSGHSIFPDILQNQCERQVVLLIDFEYSDKQVQKRYSNDDLSKSFQFDDFFIRATVNADFEDYQSNMEKFVLGKIEEAVINTKADTLIIDNMSFIMDEATDNSVAIKFMKALKRMRKKYDLSICVLGHVPKRDKTRRFTKDDLAGGKSLSNFIDSMYAIGEDANDETIKYIVQVKARDGERIYGAENVIKTVIDKDSDMLLRHRFVGFGREDDMLLKLYDDDSNREMVEEAIRLRREEKYSYRKLEAYFNNRYSAKTIERKVKKYEEEYDISGKGPTGEGINEEEI